MIETKEITLNSVDELKEFLDTAEEHTIVSIVVEVNEETKGGSDNG